MSKKMDELYANLHARVDGVGTHLKGVMAQLESGAKETEAEIRAKLNAATAKVAETKADAEAAKVRLRELAEAKQAEVEEQVTEWKAKHEKDKLERRAARAEEYAEICVEIALASAAEAEEAILDAAAARMDANNS